MLSAEDFIQPHSADSPSERNRAIERIERLSAATDDEISKLTAELVAVATNPSETKLRRVQAARILGHQARCLRIVGMEQIASQVVRVLKEEFILEPILSESAGTDSRSIHLRTLAGMDRLLLEYLLFAVFMTSATAGRKILSTLKQRADPDLFEHVQTLWQAAQREIGPSE